MTVPSAGRLGLALSSSTSACSRIASSSLSRLVPLVAETSTSRTSPPIDSTNDLVLEELGADALRVGVAGLSILLMATMIGTLAALA